MTERVMYGATPRIGNNTGYTVSKTNGVRTITRSYPNADMQTAQLVSKLQSRNSMSVVSSLRATSTELMENAYKRNPTVVNRQRNDRQPRNNVSEVQRVPGLNNNYSPYSNVNRQALEDAKKTSVVQRPKSAAQNSRPQQVTRQPAARVQSGSAASNQVRRKENSQLAESGPREVAYRRTKFPAMLVVLVVITLIFFLMMHSIVQNYEYKREIAKLESELDTLNARAVSLRLELEARDDLSYIESRAEDIGMVKKGVIEEKYISLSNSDIVENFGDGEDGHGSLVTVLSAMRRQLSGLAGGK